jgi:ubiquinone/menaquinone biosynthesis C-methylase UbiE
MLKIARRHLPTNASLQQGNAVRLPFKDETFNRVLCYHVITNFLDDDFTRSVLMQLVRVTRKGGFVLIGNTPDDGKRDEQANLIRQQWRGKKKPPLCQFFSNSLWVRFSNILAYRVLQRSVQPSLGNRFFTKDFFKEFAKQASCDIEILPLHVEGYIYAPYRFDVRLWPLQRGAIDGI